MSHAMFRSSEVVRDEYVTLQKLFLTFKFSYRFTFYSSVKLNQLGLQIGGRLLSS
jgi:hypothetical protein